MKYRDSPQRSGPTLVIQGKMLSPGIHRRRIFFVFNIKMAGLLTNIALQVEAQSLNSIVAGFSFASAIAWMDVVRWMISQIVAVSKNGGQYYVLSALFTTLLAIVVYMIIKVVARNVKINEPNNPVYAVTRA